VNLSIAVQHLHDLQALASKDPEFFKYLQENDKELLNWNPENMEEDEDEEEEFKGFGSESGEPEQEEVQTLTLLILRRWQREILQVRSVTTLLLSL
jgi:nucleolar complex protein 2